MKLVQAEICIFVNSLLDFTGGMVMSKKRVLASLLSALTLLGSKAIGTGGPKGKPSDSSGSVKGVQKEGTDGTKGVEKGNQKDQKLSPNKNDVENKKKDNKINKNDDDIQRKMALINEAFRKDPNLALLLRSKEFTTICLREGLRYGGGTLLSAGFLALVSYLASSAFRKGPGCVYEIPENVDVDMSSVVSLGRRTTMRSLVECWLKCWQNKSIGSLACRDGNDEEKTLGNNFDAALSTNNFEEAMKIYSECSPLQWTIMPTVPTGSAFGPMYVYFSDNDRKGYKGWNSALSDENVYDVSPYLLADMIQAFVDYLALGVAERGKDNNINNLLLRVYRFFVIYLHLDIRGVSALGFGFVNGKHLGMSLNEDGKFNLNGKIKTYGPSGKSALKAVKSLLCDFFDKAKKNKDVTVQQFKESMNWLFGWVYYLKWLSTSGSVKDIVSVASRILSGKRITYGTDSSKLSDTNLKEAGKRNDMVNSLFGLVDQKAPAKDVLASLSGLVRKKDDIHEIKENDIDVLAGKLKENIYAADVKPALQKFLGFLSRSEFGQKS